MANRSLLVLTALATGAFGLSAGALPAFADTPQASAPAADVSALKAAIQSAIATAVAAFTPGESNAAKKAAIEAAIQAAIAASGFDAVTARAALAQVSSSSPVVASAVEAVQDVVNPAAAQEVASANSSRDRGDGNKGGDKGGNSGGGATGGSGGGGGGGGGYIPPK